MPFRFTLRALVCQLAVGGLSLALMGGPSLSAQSPSVTKESRASGASDAETTRFVNDLLGRMTLEEKIGQMSQIALNQPQDVSPDQRIL